MLRTYILSEQATCLFADDVRPANPWKQHGMGSLESLTRGSENHQR